MTEYLFICDSYRNICVYELWKWITTGHLSNMLKYISQFGGIHGKMVLAIDFESLSLLRCGL